MERGSLFSVQGLRHKHVAADGIDVVDATRWLICAGSCDAVADADVLVLIRADLRAQKQTNMFNREENLSFSPGFSGFISLSAKTYNIFRPQLNVK